MERTKRKTMVLLGVWWLVFGVLCAIQYVNRPKFALDAGFPDRQARYERAGNLLEAIGIIGGCAIVLGYGARSRRRS